MRSVDTLNCATTVRALDVPHVLNCSMSGSCLHAHYKSFEDLHVRTQALLSAALQGIVTMPSALPLSPNCAPHLCRDAL